MTNIVTYKRTIRVEVDVRRPNGDVETIDMSKKWHRLNDIGFERIKEQTKLAGRGDVLCYRNIEEDKEYIKTENDLMDDRYEKIVHTMEYGF